MGEKSSFDVLFQGRAEELETGELAVEWISPRTCQARMKGRWT